MNTINTNKILIPIDFSETSIDAIKQGVSIAKVFRSEIILLLVKKRSEIMQALLNVLKISDEEQVKDFLENKLRELAKNLNKEYHLKVTPKLWRDEYTLKFSRMVNEWEVDLIIRGTEVCDFDNPLVLENHAAPVFTKSNSGLVTNHVSVGNAGYSNVLMPINSSEYSPLKLNSALKFTSQLGARLHVLGLMKRQNHHSENMAGSLVKPMTKKCISYTSLVNAAGIRCEKTLDYAKKIKAELIMLMAHDKLELAGLPWSIYVHQLIKSSKIPIISIPRFHRETFKYSYK